MRYKQALADSQNQIDKGYNQARQDIQPSINSAFQEGLNKVHIIAYKATG